MKIKDNHSPLDSESTDQDRVKYFSYIGKEIL